MEQSEVDHLLGEQSVGTKQFAKAFKQVSIGIVVTLAVAVPWVIGIGTILL